MERVVFAEGRLARRAAFDISPRCTSPCQEVMDFFSTENNASLKLWLFCTDCWHRFMHYICGMSVSTIESVVTLAATTRQRPPFTRLLRVLSFWADAQAEEPFPPAQTGGATRSNFRNGFQSLPQTKHRPLQDVVVSEPSIFTSPSLKCCLQYNLWHSPPSYINHLFFYFYWSSV